MSRFAVLALTAALSLGLLEGCMFGCDANGIDAQPVNMKAKTTEAGVTCGVKPTTYLRATDEKGNSLSFAVDQPASEGQSFALSLQDRTASDAENEQVVQSADGAAIMKIGMASGSDAIDTTEITSASVLITSLPEGSKPFTIEVRLGFVDGATFSEEYTAVLTPSAICQTPQ